jgi:primosomal protein N''
MTKDDPTNVVKLRQPTPTSAAGVAIDDPITPRSLMTMTDLEQDMFLQHLRERRLRVVELMRAAEAAKQRASSVVTKMKLEKKGDQVEKQLERTTKALDKLEELIYDLRALTLQHTDVDIVNDPPPATA